MILVFLAPVHHSASPRLSSLERRVITIETPWSIMDAWTCRGVGIDVKREGRGKKERRVHRVRKDGNNERRG